MTTLTLPNPPIAASRETLIAPTGIGPWRRVAELWRYRDLAWFLFLRDIQVRYKQTVLGAGWAILQPVVMMIVFTVVFGQMLGVASDIEAYPVFVYAGLLPWTFFTASVAAASMSVISSAGMLRKVYFPRLMVPLVTLGAPLMDLLLAMGVLAVLMAIYGVVPTWTVLLLPLMIGSMAIGAAGVGLTLAAWTIRYRDVRHVVPYLLQVWLFVTPVIYPLDVQGGWGWLLACNPVAGTIEACRAAVLGDPVPYGAWGVSVGVSLAVLGFGLWRFGRGERLIADLV
jgi:lipopolysaccharide transport system permease protein